jgi:hypothetical protein
MSELIQKNENRDFRWHLLAGASALVLLGYVAATSAANAEDADRPTVWIELGGQLNRLQTGQEPYAPPFTALIPPDLALPHQVQKPTQYGFDENAALTFEPQGSDWSFSASLRYGRSSSSKQAHQQSSPGKFYTSFVNKGRFYGVYHHNSGHGYALPVAARFSDAVARQNESHMLLDFQAGKDVGMGLFGRHASSSLNVGVRFAQFTSRSRVALRADPDWQFKAHQVTFSSYYTYAGYAFSRYLKHSRVFQPFHVYNGTLLASRSFNGLGPSVAWNSSETIAGNSDRGELLFDWGVNAALLFGRQKAKVHHQTTGRYHSSSYVSAGVLPITYQRPATPDRARSRSVVVPNIGGFVGLSVKYPNVKVGFGYKADFFFGAMDGGIDSRRSEDVGFHGPYASVSIGLGG